VKFLTLSSDNMVWTPDTFFRNEKEASFHQVPNKQTYMRVFPNGDVQSSMRLKVKLYCPMNLRLYPFDTQTCKLQLASYSGTKDIVSYHWKEGTPIQVTSNLILPEMLLSAIKAERCDVMTSTGTYSCISANFVLTRAYGSHILMTYVPYMMMVIITWFTFWLKPSDSTVKVGINLLILLWITMKSDSLNQALPKVAYTKAIDIWTGWCTMFIFLSLVESIIVSRSADTEDVKESKKFSWRGKSFSYKIDLISRIIFPAAFLLFIIIYFATFITSNEEVCMSSDEGYCMQLM